MKFTRILLFAAFLVLGLSGCQVMFTTSLGSALERKTYNIPSDISASDAKAILADPDSPPAALAALLDVLNAQAATSTNSAGLAVEAAIGASELSTAVGQPIMQAAQTALSGGSPSSADISALVSSLQDVATNTAVMDAFARLDSGSGTIDPAVLAASGLSPTDMILVALVVASSQLPPGQDPTASGFDATAFKGTDEAKLAAALITQAAADIAASGGDASMADTLKDSLNLS